MWDQSPKPGFLECTARAPTKAGGSVTARLSREKFSHYYSNGPAHKAFEAAHCVRAVLADPNVIIRYKEDEWSGYCYARHVPHRFTNKGAEVPCPEGFIFLVFLTESMRIVEWGFEGCDSEETDLPMNDRDGAMKEIIWSR